MTTGHLTTRPEKADLTLVWRSIANDYQVQMVLCMEQKSSFAHKVAFIGEVPYLEHDWILPTYSPTIVAGTSYPFPSPSRTIFVRCT